MTHTRGRPATCVHRLVRPGSTLDSKKRPIRQSMLMRPGPVKGSPKVKAKDMVSPSAPPDTFPLWKMKDATEAVILMKNATGRASRPSTSRIPPKNSEHGTPRNEKRERNTHPCNIGDKPVLRSPSTATRQTLRENRAEKEPRRARVHKPVPVVASSTAIGNTRTLSGRRTSPLRRESQRVVCEGSFCDSSALIERCTMLHTWMPMGRRIP